MFTIIFAEWMLQHYQHGKIVMSFGAKKENEIKGEKTNLELMKLANH
jgi:hypothetical protein